PISDFLNYRPAVFATGHPFEALRVAHQQNLSIVPVVDNQNNYLGAITKDNLLKYMTENSGVDNPGGIIVLEMHPHNYSLSEIARICENEDVIITSVQLRPVQESGKLEITLKANKNDLHGLAASFERHDFTVKQIFGEQSHYEDVMDRYKLLMSYINM